MQFNEVRKSSRDSNARSRRRGYTLVVCIVMILICSAMLITLLNMSRLQILETTARAKLSSTQLLSDAAFEHAIAVLIDTPNYRGTVGPVEVKSVGGFYSFEVADNGGGMAITSTGIIDSSSQSQTTQITQTQLNDRRAKLGL